MRQHPYLQCHGGVQGQASEPGADAQDRAVHEHVEPVSLPALALYIVDGQGPVADHARERDAVIGAEVEAVAAKGLPGKIAPGAETADVSAQKELVLRRHRIADASPDERIEPVDRTGPGNGPCTGNLKI